MGLFTGGAPERRSAGGTWAPEPPIAPFLGADATGATSVDRNPDLALQVPTVWACVDLLAGSLSSLPLETFDRPAGALGTPRRIADPSLLTSPDDGMSQSEWLHMLMVSLALRGNAYGYIGARSYRSYPTSVHLLNPDTVSVELNRAGRRQYRVGPDRTIIPAEDMWHVRGMTMPGSMVGLSPISYAARTINVDLNSREFANGFFAGGGIPKAVLESDQQIQQDQARTIKDRVMGTLKGREPLVLGLGLKYQQIQVKPEESQFLATQRANVGQIARYFRVPAEMVGGEAGGSMTYSNREQRSLDFLTYSLAFWLKRVEDAMYVLLPGQQHVKFNVQQLLRTDAETQAKVFVQYLAGKVLAPSEVRAELGRDPMTEAQKAESDLVPLTITPLGGPKALPDLKTPPGPEAPVPATDTQGESSAA